MGLWISERDLNDMATGAAVLGTGGGGNPYVGKLMAMSAVRRYGQVAVVSPHEVPDDATIICVAGMGAPTVAYEKLPNADAPHNALRRLERHLGVQAYAVVPMECGGSNSLVPFMAAARARIPVVDADGMGRAFPELQMVTFHIYGLKGWPLAVYGARGDNCIVEALDNYYLENLARGIVVRMGGHGHVAFFAMTGKQLKETAIPNTLTLAMRLGRAIREARAAQQDPIAAIVEVTANSLYGPGIPFFRGKVLAVERRTGGGFVRGKAVVAGLDEFQGEILEVDFQNENLIARSGERVLAMVPDLITFLDAETGVPITTEAIRYGFRVVALGIPTPAMMRTEAALKVWGPRPFGYQLDYQPIEAIHRSYYERYHLLLREGGTTP